MSDTDAQIFAKRTGERIAGRINLVNSQIATLQIEIAVLEDERKELQEQCPHDVTRESRCEGERSSEICQRCGHVN